MGFNQQYNNLAMFFKYLKKKYQFLQNNDISKRL